MFFGKTIANNMASQSTSTSDYQLQLYVDQVMRRYDTNNNGVLEPDEIVLFFNELFAQYGINKRITQWEAINLMRKVDTNFDGKANKFQLFRAFKAMSSNMNAYGTNNSYASQWDPNFSGYQKVSPSYNAYGTGYGNNYGGMYGTGYAPGYNSGYGTYATGGYNNYGAIGYTTPVIYGGYRY